MTMTVEKIGVILSGSRERAALVAKYAIERGVVFEFSFNAGVPQFSLLKSDYPEFQKAMSRVDRELNPPPSGYFRKGDKVVVRGFDMALVFDHYTANGRLARVFVEGESYKTGGFVLFARPWSLAPNDERTMKEEGWLEDLKSASVTTTLTEAFIQAAEIESQTPITAGSELIG